MTAGARHAIISLFIFAVFIGVASGAFTLRQVDQVRQIARAQCKFDAHVGAAPIVVSPATHKASLLGVQIVSDARQAWYGLGCPGRLEPPAPSFVRWAKAYHLPYK
jgi:hypothetical protein